MLIQKAEEGENKKIRKVGAFHLEDSEEEEQAAEEQITTPVEETKEEVKQAVEPTPVATTQKPLSKKE